MNKGDRFVGIRPWLSATMGRDEWSRLLMEARTWCGVAPKMVVVVMVILMIMRTMLMVHIYVYGLLLN
jgi:hypothetical protein